MLRNLKSRVGRRVRDIGFLGQLAIFVALPLVALFSLLNPLILIRDISDTLASVRNFDVKDKAEAYRAIIPLYVAIFGAALAPALVVWRMYMIHAANKIQIKNYYKDLMLKAIENLGATREQKIKIGGRADAETVETERIETLPNVNVRIGAIHILERIARESSDDFRAAMEILCAYVRENGTYASQMGPVQLGRRVTVQDAGDGDKQTADAGMRCREDILAAIVAIGRRRPPKATDLDGLSLNITGAWLRGLNLSVLNLSGVILDDVNFENAKLTQISFTGCRIHRMNLTGARLETCDFSGSIIATGCNCTRAKFVSGKFIDSEFAETELKSSVFSECDLSGLKFTKSNPHDIYNITQEQINSTFGDSFAGVPNGLSRPSHWAKRGDGS